MNKNGIPSMQSYLINWRKQSKFSLIFDEVEDWPIRNNTDKIISEYEIDRRELEIQLSKVQEHPKRFINPELSENRLRELLKYREKLFKERFEFMYTLEQLEGEHNES